MKWLRSRWGLASIACGALISLFALGVFVVAQSMGLEFSGAELEREMARSKNLGVPLEAKDLSPMHDPSNTSPDSQAVRKFQREWDESEKGLAETVDDVSQFRPSVMLQNLDVEKCAVWLKLHKEQVSWAVTRSKAEKVQFRRDFDRAIALDLVEYGAMRNLLRGLAVQAFFCAANDDVEGAFEALGAMRTWTEWTQSEKFVVSAMIHVSCQGMVARTVECIAVAWSESLPRLERLEAFMAQDWPKVSIRDILRSDAYSSIATARNLWAFGGWRFLRNDARSPIQISDTKYFQRKGEPPGLLEQSCMLGALKFWNDFFEYSAINPGPDSWVDWLEERREVVTSGPGVHARFLRRVLPSFRFVGPLQNRALATQRVTVALIRAFRFRLGKDRWPTDMNELGPGLDDPFSNTSLRMLSEGVSFRVYSVGANRIDDGGITPFEAPNRQRDRSDIVAGHPLPPRRF